MAARASADHRRTSKRGAGGDCRQSSMRCTYRPVLALAFLATSMLAPPLSASAAGPPTVRLRRRAGWHHPSDLRRISHRRHRSRRHRRRPSRRHHPAHAGGLLDSTRAIVSRMITSRAPVVVFVGPAGARAASAGFMLMMAADVAAMAPGTHIGAAHPVSAAGRRMDETTRRRRPPMWRRMCGRSRKRAAAMWARRPRPSPRAAPSPIAKRCAPRRR